MDKKIHGLYSKVVYAMTIMLFMSLTTLNISSFAQENTSDQTAEEMINQYLKHDFLQLNVLLQGNVHYSIHDTKFQGGRTFQVPNARIGLSGDLDENFYYGVLYNVAREQSLLDAYIGWKYTDLFRIQLGAMKPRFSADFIPDPVTHDFVDRSRLPAHLGLTRQLGVMVMGDINRFSWFAGVFNGNRLRANDNNKFDFLVRLEGSETVTDGMLDVGVNAMFGETTQSPVGVFIAVERSIFGADIRYENQEFLIAAEYLYGQFESVDFDREETINGFYVTAGHYIEEDLLALLRLQNMLHTAGEFFEGSQVTLGVKKFVTSLVSVEANIDVYNPGTDEKSQFGITLNANLLF